MGIAFHENFSLVKIFHAFYNPKKPGIIISPPIFIYFSTENQHTLM